ncbi:MAG: DUF3298 and DUF4163 domain-containing protein [Candidatus Azobacteroides sp.]|nr:DUF3298 and DUF4163 domain-containing protein [Candidatus Azobacteroides sp.]
MNFSASKKICYFILTVSVFFSLVSISCTKKTKSDENEVTFDTIRVDKVESVDYKKSKLKCNLHITFTYPIACKKTSRLSDLQTMFVEKVFSSQYADFSPQDAVKNFSENYINVFKSTRFDDFFDEDSLLEDETGFIYEQSLENEILYNKNGFISFVVKNTAYEGGAHGSNSINGYVIDLNSGKFLTEDDFAGNNYQKNLSSLLVQKIATAKGLDNASQLETIGYNAIEDIVPNGNFTIDDKGITYYFNEYEIAAYFVGITEVFIPYEELKAYITNDNPVIALVGR